MTTPPFGLHVTTTRGATVVQATGELDLASAPHLRDCLRQLIDAGSRRLVVDLRGVTFLDSSGLGVLVGARRLLERNEPDGDWSMRLVCAGGSVLRVLRVTGLHRAFSLHATLPEALGGHPDHPSDQGNQGDQGGQAKLELA